MNNIDLKENRAIVTGAARGVGFAIAKRLLESGAQVAMWDRDVTELEKAAASLGNEAPIVTVAVDVSDPESVEKARKASTEKFGGIDILVNNAGIAGDNATVWETEINEW